MDRSGASGGSDDLGKRLDSLPDGHPSSRYEADGSLRESAVDLRSLDTGVDDDPAEAPTDRTLITDSEWSDQVSEVSSTLEKAHLADEATDHRFTTDPDRRQWTAERNRIQGGIVSDLLEGARDVPSEHKAIIAGGLGGSGKTTVLDKYAGIDRSKYLTINPDNVKEEMAVRGLIPTIEGLSPMEAADLVHEESSVIAKQLARRALADGKNVIWDITMSSRESTESRIDDLRAAGYTVEGIFVEIPVELSVQRSDSRHREGEEDYRAGVGLGGRYVPPDVIRSQVDPDWGSKNRKTFEDVRHLFDQWSRYDNSRHEQPAVLVEKGRPDNENREDTAR